MTRFVFFVLLLPLALTLPALAVTITTPNNNAQVTSPVSLDASADSCSSHPVHAMGYSVDSSTDTTIVDKAGINAEVPVPTGKHTIHVKAWNTQGTECVEDVNVDVTSAGASNPPASSASAFPAATAAATKVSSAGITVSSPYNGTTHTSPFTLTASASTCQSQSVTGMGYSLDNSSNTSIVHARTVGATITAGNGKHTLHVKSWGSGGAYCVASVALTISGSSQGPPATSSGGGATGSSVSAPSGAKTVSSIQSLSGWVAAHDKGMPGSASGSTAVVTSPVLSGHSRKFAAHWSSNGGMRFSKSFADDRTSLNFLYDAWVYISSSSGSIANIEMDLNQTMTSGSTLIFGFQCDGWKGKWDYSENTGSSTKPIGKWVSTSLGCSPSSWSRNKWHHIQIAYSRASSGGHITYKSVTFDGTTHSINKTVFAARSMGWGSSIVTNFQIDGRGSGSATVYLDKLTVSRW